MNQVSMLAKEVVESLRKTACENLAQDGFLVPVLVLNIGAKSPDILALMEFPNTPQKKHVYFAQIGTQYTKRGQLIQEAILISESWMVLAQQAPAAFAISPSQHPCRQEVLVLIGRNAAHSRGTQVVQPFTRDTANKPVWREPAMAVYNEPVEHRYRTQGVLDDLFLANQRSGV